MESKDETFYVCWACSQGACWSGSHFEGLVARRRDLGGLIFIDLRDREGIMQLVINPETVAAEIMATAESLRSEYVIEVTGKVAAREQVNDKLATGSVELHVESLTVLNTAKTTPFEIKDGIEVNDDTRLRYRYLDLRRPEMLELQAACQGDPLYPQLSG